MSLTQSSPKSNSSYLLWSPQEQEVIHKNNLSGLVIRVYMAISQHCYGQKVRCFPSITRLQSILGGTKKSSIHRAINKLIEVGLIERTAINRDHRTFKAFWLKTKQTFLDALAKVEEKMGVSKPVSKRRSKRPPTETHRTLKKTRSIKTKKKINPSSYLTVPEPSPFTKMERLFNSVVHHQDVSRLSSVQLHQLKASINEGIEDWVPWAFEIHPQLIKKVLEL